MGNKTIKIKCDGTMFINYKKLHEFQEEIKTISRKNIDKLKASILEDGYKAPGFIWKNKNYRIWIELAKKSYFEKNLMLSIAKPNPFL